MLALVTLRLRPEVSYEVLKVPLVTGETQVSLAKIRIPLQGMRAMMSALELSHVHDMGHVVVCGRARCSVLHEAHEPECTSYRECVIIACLDSVSI